jgi:hypothetical protein
VTVGTERRDRWGPWLLAASGIAAFAATVARSIDIGRLHPLVLPALVPALMAIAWVALRERRAGEADPSPVGVEVRRFRVDSVTGELVACVLRGTLSGDEVRHGDIVRVSGHPHRDGHLVAQRVEVLDSVTGPVVSRIRPRVPWPHRARWARWIPYALAVVLALAAPLVVTGLLD